MRSLTENSLFHGANWRQWPEHQQNWSRAAKGGGNTSGFREQESLLGEDPNIDQKIRLLLVHEALATPRIG